jgi:predicted  nucleic acid-binding Zn-ribbon protein
VKDLITLLIKLQEADSRILEKRLFINKVPSRIFEVDEPFRHAKSELEKMKQKNEMLTKKKREKEKMLEDTNEKIKKMKSRASELKTNKEYQAHLKEIESAEREIGVIEEQILVTMEELDSAVRQQKQEEEAVNIETTKLSAFKKELEGDVVKFESELTALKDERAKLVSLLKPDVYKTYMFGLNAGGGVAVTGARNEICLGCNMNIPPQLFVEIRKNEEIIQCPQCRRILYYADEQ